MSIKVFPLKLLMSNAFLVQQHGSLMLVDAGMPGEEGRILRGIKSTGYEKLDLIFITHAHIDHYGSAAALREITGAAIAVHVDDSEALAMGETRLGTARGIGRPVARILPVIQRVWRTPPAPADLFLEDGEFLTHNECTATVLHTPGHTMGSSCLLVEDTAFVGDLITTTGNRSRLQRFYAEAWPLLRPSLDKLAASGPKLLFPGHGKKSIDAIELGRLAAE
jgi:hydroxyacylglutathione hydrolase